MAESCTEEVAVPESVTEEAAETIVGDVAEEAAETIAEKEAETEKITVKLAEFEELVKRKGSPPLNTAKHGKFANFTKSTKCRITKILKMPKSFV